MLRLGFAGVCRCLGQSNDILSRAQGLCAVTAIRHLYSRERLGIENFIRNQDMHNTKMVDLKERFHREIREFMEQAHPVVFTADLKAMIHLTEDDDDLQLTEKMVRLYQKQQSDLSFAQFNFGPLLLRLLYILDKPEKAFKLYSDKELLDSGLFDQMSSQLILLDMLYEAGRYDDVHTAMEAITRRQVGGVKYPIDCVTVALTACHKQDTPDSYDKMVAYIHGCKASGQDIAHRAMVHAILLAIKQEKYNEAMEMLSLIPPINRKNQRQPLAVQNVKLLTYARLGRLEDALMLLRGVLEKDVPDHMRAGGEVFSEVLSEVDVAVTAADNKELTQQFSALLRALRQGSHIAEVELAEYVFREVASKRQYQDGFRARKQQRRTEYRGGGRQY